MPKEINHDAFRAMCGMWGVDQAIKAARQMGLFVSNEIIAAERKKEEEQLERLKSIFNGMNRNA